MISTIIVALNKNIKMSSFKSSKNIQKKEGGPDRSVSDYHSSSVTLNKLHYLIFYLFNITLMPRVI